MTQATNTGLPTSQCAPRRVAARRGMLSLGVGLIALLAGCGQTERTITVTSEPSGAMVYVNGVEKGRTPVTFDFVWYGDYRFELSKDGCETLKDHRKVKAPPHEWVGVDLVKEVFIPATFTDAKSFHFVLMPMAKVTEGELIERAQAMRDETLHKEN